MRRWIRTCSGGWSQVSGVSEVSEVSWTGFLFFIPVERPPTPLVGRFSASPSPRAGILELRPLALEGERAMHHAIP